MQAEAAKMNDFLFDYTDWLFSLLKVFIMN